MSQSGMTTSATGMAASAARANGSAANAANAASGGAILRATNLHKTYRMGRVKVPVLRGVDLTVKRGEWVAILGASGSGKSTLLHLLGGLDRPDRQGTATVCGKCKYDVSALDAARASKRIGRCPECNELLHVSGGAISFEDRELAKMSSRELDRYRTESVGFVFQFYHLLPELTVMQNVTIASMVRLGRFGYMAQRSKVEARARGLLESFGLGHRLTHRPAELSGGERQRVAIARALANEPPVLLADEPTGNLDHATGETILDQIAKHRADAGLTMVMVTHDRDIAKRADRVVQLTDGRVA